MKFSTLRAVAVPLLAGLILQAVAPSAFASYDFSGIETWLKGQQVPTAAVPFNDPGSFYYSFQTTPTDPRVIGADSLNQFANTYDNAMVGLYSLASGVSGGAARAQSILTFYSKYNTKGDPTGLVYKSNQEFYASTGELVWMGMLAAQYENKTGDHQFNAMLQADDNYLLDPAMNLNGGVRLGHDYTGAASGGASTENNIDVLSYLEMRYQMLMARNAPGDAAEAQKLRTRQLAVAKWIVNDAYIPSEGRLRRGEQDNVFAADTHFWAIDSFTQLKTWDPSFYTSSGLSVIDLPKLMRYAEAHAQATVPYLKPDGTTVPITGFRFTDETNLTATQANAPISFEWTAMAARAYDALGETANAAGVRANLAKAEITGPNGSQSWAYASQPGMTFYDGWYATAYPALASTLWSALALSGTAANWPFSFGTKAPADPSTSTQPTQPTPPVRRRPGPNPLPIPHPLPNPRGLFSMVVGAKSPSDNYVPLKSAAGLARLQANFRDNGTLPSVGNNDPTVSPHDVLLP